MSLIPSKVCLSGPSSPAQPLTQHKPAPAALGEVHTACQQSRRDCRRWSDPCGVLQPHLLHGVDISNSKYLQRPKVLAAAEFAAEAHKGQHRRTGEPYISHCVHTAAIVEALMAQNHVQEADQRCTHCQSWSLWPGRGCGARACCMRM